MHYGDAKQDGGDNNLYHGHCAERCQDIVGEHVDDLVHEGEFRHVRALTSFLNMKIDGGNPILDEGGHHQSQGDGYQRGESEI